jgi:hypothetical protein
VGMKHIFYRQPLPIKLARGHRHVGQIIRPIGKSAWVWCGPASKLGIVVAEEEKILPSLFEVGFAGVKESVG